ncbi:MAG: DNA polymerase III subunit gamma/tau [Elusimicrobiaceae bacterium]|nr:DNA polymerase III subunit gamma/tau [Elusimicrobiaceae bacterium]
MHNTTPYINLASKYRPQTFEEFVGQESVSTTLKNALKSGRISHAYLFYGPRGCGKTTTARLLAKALNCTGNDNTAPTATPCGTCPQCKEIASSSDMDVLELDAASNTQVEKVRQAIIDTISLASARDRYKVFILDEVHMLSDSSFNVLLKTIEEPPAPVVFILATTELNKVPLTITSRCQTYRFKPISEQDITNHLLDLAQAEGLDLEEDAAKVIAHAAGGALRDALTIMDRAIAFSQGKITKERVASMLGLLPQDLVIKAAKALILKDTTSMHQVFSSLKEEGFEALSLLKDLKNTLGELFYYSLKTSPVPFEEADTLLKEARPVYIAGLTRKIGKLIDEVKFSDTPALIAEVGLFTIMESTFDVDSFITRLENIEKGLLPENTEKKTLNEPSLTKETLQKDSFSSPKTENIQNLKQAFEEKKPELSAQERWVLFTKNISAKHPFLYEILQSAKVELADKTNWILTFRHNDTFLKDTLTKRLQDFKNLAQNLFGEQINFELKLLPEQKFKAPLKKAAKTLYAISKPKTEAKKVIADTPVKQVAAKEQLLQKTEEKPLISKAKPFVKEDFSAFIETPKISKTLENILDIFDGQVVESL